MCQLSGCHFRFTDFLYAQALSVSWLFDPLIIKLRVIWQQSICTTFHFVEFSWQKLLLIPFHEKYSLSQFSSNIFFKSSKFSIMKLVLIFFPNQPRKLPHSACVQVSWYVLWCFILSALHSGKLTMGFSEEVNNASPFAVCKRQK